MDIRYQIYKRYESMSKIHSFFQIEFFVQIKDSNRRRIGASIVTSTSIYEVLRKGSGAMKAEAPSMTKIFIIFDPTTFPMAISGFHLLAATIEVTSSGILVPIATTVNHIIACDNQKYFAIFTEPSTRIFQPIKRTIIPPIIQRIAFQVEVIISTSSLSSGIKLLCFTE